jgi:arylformamidase
MSPFGNGTSVVLDAAAGTVLAELVVTASFGSFEQAAIARAKAPATAMVHTRGRRGFGLRFTDTWTTVLAASISGQGRVACWAWDQRPYVRGLYSGPVSDLEQEYSPSSRAGGSAAPFIEDYRSRSATARRALADRMEELPGGTLLVCAAVSAPLLVFIHGGYWQALSAEESLFLAPAALAAGSSFASVEYTIAPEGDLARMVRECRGALEQLAAVGGFASVVLAGHSAGAQLAAMAALVEEPPLPVDHVVLVSGVYDLRPLVHTTVNDPLGLTVDTAADLSPALLPVVNRQRVTVTWGDNDTDAFRAQGHVYAAKLRAAGLDVVEHERAGRHHFDILDDLVGLVQPGRP